MIPANIGVLIDEYLDGSIGAEGMKTLEAWLKQSQGNMDSFLSHVDVHVRLESAMAAAPQLHLEPETGTAEQTERVSFWRRLPVRLAAAATLIVSAGLIWWLVTEKPDNSPKYAMGRMIKQIGQVTVTDRSTVEDIASEVTTGPGSSCRIEQPDRTALAAGEQTRLEWRRHEADRAQNLTVQKGLAYVEFAPQTRPYKVQVGRLNAEVLGTRILAEQGVRTALSVFHGRMKTAVGNSRTVVLGGQTAGVDGNGMVVTGLPALNNQYAWLGQLGFEPDSITKGSELPAALADGNALDFSMYRISGGDWSITYGKQGPVAVQNDISSPEGAALSFGASRWLKGVWSCKARMLQTSTNPAINVAFTFASGESESFGAKNTPPLLLAKNSTFFIKAYFEINGEKDILSVGRLELWPENNPKDKLVAGGWVMAPGSSGVKNVRGPCAPGLHMYRCAVELSEFRLENATPAK